MIVIGPKINHLIGKGVDNLVRRAPLMNRAEKTSHQRVKTFLKLRDLLGCFTYRRHKGGEGPVASLHVFILGLKPARVLPDRLLAQFTGICDGPQGIVNALMYAEKIPIFPKMIAVDEFEFALVAQPAHKLKGAVGIGPPVHIIRAAHKNNVLFLDLNPFGLKPLRKIVNTANAPVIFEPERISDQIPGLRAAVKIRQKNHLR